jgi:hypothetical protein
MEVPRSNLETRTKIATGVPTIRTLAMEVQIRTTTAMRTRPMEAPKYNLVISDPTAMGAPITTMKVPLMAAPTINPIATGAPMMIIRILPMGTRRNNLETRTKIATEAPTSSPATKTAATGASITRMPINLLDLQDSRMDKTSKPKSSPNPPLINNNLLKTNNKIKVNKEDRKRAAEEATSPKDSTSLSRRLVIA